MRDVLSANYVFCSSTSFLLPEPYHTFLFVVRWPLLLKNYHTRQKIIFRSFLGKLCCLKQFLVEKLFKTLFPIKNGIYLFLLSDRPFISKGWTLFFFYFYGPKYLSSNTLPAPEIFSFLQTVVFSHNLLVGISIHHWFVSPRTESTLVGCPYFLTLDDSFLSSSEVPNNFEMFILVWLPEIVFRCFMFSKYGGRL